MRSKPLKRNLNDGYIMRKIINMFKYARKGSKQAKRARARSKADVQWPEGIRIGIFGHENTGKTVFLTVLDTGDPTDEKFKITGRDDTARAYHFNNKNQLEGRKINYDSEGTITTINVPRQFPDPTSKGTVLKVTTRIDKKTAHPVVFYDYKGKALSLAEAMDEEKVKILDFMAGCDGLLFFFDPKILQVDPLVQERVTAFINVLESIVPQNKRLPLPVGLVINKADILPGYEGEMKSVLIRPQDEQVVANDYESFLEGVLGFESLENDKVWASTVRNVLVKLSAFIRVVVGRTLDFQVYFVSNTGNSPRKIGEEKGRSIYEPPEKIVPSGVVEPVYWMIRSIVRNRRLGILRIAAKITAIASSIFIIVWSIPFIINFAFYNSAYRTEMKMEDKTEVIEAYSSYQKKLFVRSLFNDYYTAASRMKEALKNMPGYSIEERMNIAIDVLAGTVMDESFNGKNMSEDLQISLDRIEWVRKTFENEPYGILAGRVIEYWEHFVKYRKDRGKNEKSKKALEEYSAMQPEALPHRNDYESRFRGALGLAVGEKPQGNALEEYNELKKQVNASDDLQEILGARDELRRLRSRLRDDIDKEQIAEIDGFIEDMAALEKEYRYVFSPDNMPEDYHVHLAVVERGKKPEWARGEIHKGTPTELKWKAGKEIHVALCENADCKGWGKSAVHNNVVAFRDRYAILGLIKGVEFANVGKPIKFQIKRNNRQIRIPRLESNE